MLVKLAAFYGVDPSIFRICEAVLQRLDLPAERSTNAGVGWVVGNVIATYEFRGSVKRKGRLPASNRRSALRMLEAMPPLPMPGDDFLAAVEREVQSALQLSGA